MTKPTSADLVKDSTTTTGTGDITLSGTAPVGFQSFNDGIGTGKPFGYRVSGGAEWECGIGQLSSATTMTRSPTASSNAGALVSFSGGTKEIICTITAAQANGFFTADDADSPGDIPDGGTPSDSDVLFGTSNGTSLVGWTLSALKDYFAGVTPVPGTVAYNNSSSLVEGATNTITYDYSGGAPSGATFTLGGTPVTISPTITPSSGSGQTEAGTIVFDITNPSAGTVAAVLETTGPYGASAPSENLVITSSGTATYILTATDFGGPDASGSFSGGSANGAGLIKAINAATGDAPLHIKMGWSKSNTVPPAAYTDTAIPPGSGNASSWIELSPFNGVWTNPGSQSQSFYGQFNVGGPVVAYGTPGVWYPWFATDDGFVGVFGTGVTFS